MSKASDWASTHLCQGERADCPCLYIHYGEDGQEAAAFPGKKLEKYRVYCTRDGKLRTICANLASWTGLTPKWCALRSTEAGASAGAQESAGMEAGSCDRARSFDSAGGLAQDDGNAERSKQNG